MSHSRFSRNCCITALFLGLCLPASGQDRPENERPTAPALNVRESDIPALIKAAKDAGISLDYQQTTSTEHAAGDGASAKAVGDKLDQKLDSSSPGAKLSGGSGATGGSTKAQVNAENFQFSWLPIMLGLAGIGCWAGAIWKFKQGEKDTAAGLGAGGVVFLLVAWFPAMLWLLAIAVIAIALPHFLPDKEKKQAQQLNAEAAAALKKKQEALRAVADGIAKLPETTKRAVLNSIAGEAEAVHGDHETIERSVDSTLPAIRIPRDAPTPA